MWRSRSVPRILNLGPAPPVQRGRERRASSVGVVLGSLALVAAMPRAARHAQPLVLRTARAAPGRLHRAFVGVGLHTLHHLVAAAAVPVGVVSAVLQPVRGNRSTRPTRGSVALESERRNDRRGHRSGSWAAADSAEAGYLPALERVAGARVVAVADPDPSDGARGDVAWRDGRAPVPSPRTPTCTRAARRRPRPDARRPRHARRATTSTTPAPRRTPASPALLEKPPAPDADAARPRSPRSSRPPVDRVQPSLRPRRGPGPRRTSSGTTSSSSRFELTYRRRSWAPVQVHDDALLDLGPHLVDWARWITGGELDDVRATRARARTGGARRRAPDAASPTLIAATDARYRERIEVAHARPATLVARHRRGGAGRRGARPAPRRRAPARGHARGRARRVRRRGTRRAPRATRHRGRRLAVMQVARRRAASAAAGGAPIATGHPFRILTRSDSTC